MLPKIAPRVSPSDTRPQEDDGQHYAPAAWHPGNAQNTRNNCYRYATNRPSDGFGYPGWGGDPARSTVEAPTFSCPQLDEALIIDGLLPVSFEGDCGSGIKIGAAVTRRPQDWHFYRQTLVNLSHCPELTQSTTPGDLADLQERPLFTHKPGRDFVTHKDAEGKCIIDPRQANRGKYVNWCGFYCVPAEAKIAGPAPGAYGGLDFDDIFPDTVFSDQEVLAIRAAAVLSLFAMASCCCKKGVGAGILLAVVGVSCALAVI